MPKVLVDTNLMLLLAVGLTDQTYVGKHKRLQAYELADFAAIVDIVSAFSGIVACPNIWTETSNLARYTNEPLRGKIADTMKRLIDTSEEVLVETKSASLRPEYRRLGVTDATLLTISETGSVLLTDDLHLYLAAENAGYQAINYNYIRDERYSRG